MPFGKPKEPKQPKAPKEKKPKKEKPPKVKKGKKGQAPAEEVEGGEPKKKKLPLPLMLLPAVVIVAAAAIIILFVLPRLRGGDADAEPTPTPEPQPPALPTELVVGETSIVGMALEADESGALYEKAKTVTYTYTNLVDAGKAAQTYANQLMRDESPGFAFVDEEFVRLRERPDFTAADGMALLARNIPVEEPAATDPPKASQDPEADGSQAPEASPEPVVEPVYKVHTVRITWSTGVCVVTADEQLGRVTSPPPSTTNSASRPVTIYGAQDELRAMSPAQLGLTGESMSEYEVLPANGTEMVDGVACIRLNVYSGKNSAQTHQFMGSYLMSIDGQHLYRLDPATNQIVELEYDPE